MNKFKYLLAAFSLCLSCQKSPSPKADEVRPQPNPGSTPTDAAVVFPQELLGGTFMLGRSTFSLPEKDKFEIVFHSDVRYFRDEHNEELVRCKLGLKGKIEFSKSSEVSDRYKSLSTSLEVRSVSMLGSGEGHGGVCNLYAEALEKEKNFQLHISDYGSEFVSFSHFDFGIPGEKTNYEFSGYAIRDYHFSNRELGRPYFVKQNAQIRVTESVMTIVRGNYIHIHNELESNVVISDRAMTFSNTACGLEYTFAIGSVYFDPQGLMTAFSIVDYPSDNTDSNAECSELRALVENLVTTPKTFSVDVYGKDPKEVSFGVVPAENEIRGYGFRLYEKR